jgi:hypothetical protein
MSTTTTQDREAYERRKEYDRSRLADQSAKGRDIGAIPDDENHKRKAACQHDFRHFLLTYFKHVFYLPLCPDHDKIIAKGQRAVLGGELSAFATPRGFGKTSICEALCVWALLYGHSPFVALFGPDAGLAQKMLESIKRELETNELLAADFRKVCLPIAKLEGISQRCAGQLCLGKRTYITWSADEIVLPTIPSSPASGSVIRTAGLTASFRGMKHKRADGSVIRPSLVVIDDCQTDESANSPSQCAARERLIAGAILGLAGPSRRISGLMPCTVIRRGDVADNILDRQKHPEWNGERTKMVYSFPTNTKLWEEYADIRAESLRQEKGLAPATAFYVANRAAMDEGATVAWPEESGIQHAMNLKLRNEDAFWAEYQNEPKEEAEGVAILNPDAIAAKLTRLERGTVPLACTHLTAFVDVQQDLLYYLVLAVSDDFSGSIIDCGAWPDQKRQYWSLHDARPTLSSLMPSIGLEGTIYAGLQQVTEHLLAREWQREGGGSVKVDKLAIDAAWSKTTDTVFLFSRQSAHSAIILPYRGHFIGASSLPMDRWRAKEGERQGLNWRIMRGRRARPWVIADANWWRSFTAERLSLPMGSKGSISVWGSKPDQHRLLCEHLTSERPKPTMSQGRKVDEWKLVPGRENHFWDCLVGCCILASITGASLMGEQPKPRGRDLKGWAERRAKQMQAMRR